MGIFSVFGYNKEHPFVVSLVLRFHAPLGCRFIQYKIGDSKEETKRIMWL
jgi:hypothetical protein